MSTLENINTESQNNKNQKRNSIFKERLGVGGILIAIGVVILLTSFVYNQIFIFLIFGLVIVIGLGITYEFAKNFYKNEFSGKRLMATIGMSFYSYTSLFLFLSLMFISDKAISLFVLIIAPAAISNAVSFYVGKTKGKKKIVRRISPGKTWAGTVAGYLVSLVVTRILLEILFPSLEFWQMGITSISIPLLAFMGDLIESAWKRIMGIKDSGNVFRGHGGFLDITDSYLLVIYAIYGFTFWFL